jgi:integrase
VRLSDRHDLGRGNDGKGSLARRQALRWKTWSFEARSTRSRRSCARLCHSAGGELEQIQFLLGHVSVQTTEKYLGCKQRFREAVNDEIGIEPGA